jgi:hypothetical protein
MNNPEKVAKFGKHEAFINELSQLGGFLRFSPSIKLTTKI